MWILYYLCLPTASKDLQSIFSVCGVRGLTTSPSNLSACRCHKTDACVQFSEITTGLIADSRRLQPFLSSCASRYQKITRFLLWLKTFTTNHLFFYSFYFPRSIHPTSTVSSAYLSPVFSPLQTSFHTQSSQLHLLLRLLIPVRVASSAQVTHPGAWVLLISLGSWSLSITGSQPQMLLICSSFIQPSFLSCSSCPAALHNSSFHFLLPIPL